MKRFVEVTTNPVHSEYQDESEPGTEFPFHPWLASKIREKLGREDLRLRLSEISCEEVACPVMETRIEVVDTTSGKTTTLLRFGRKKEQINKLDLQLSFQKMQIL
ncbi:hypothetical protein [Leptospira saintgironsiae]|uniref:Uncharacterized protein n=1 Tax=Leptospira saintgironsiae TaxID=2023183 RepID=A0A2M9YAU4_9LEPT|nr:hypothetical protein [Leptospira saintgironsiae]PJZ48670.1 hypothetical protein CH362_12935 [Leptospira saintgironsiae]